MNNLYGMDDDHSFDMDDNDPMTTEYLIKLKDLSPLVNNYFMSNMYIGELGNDNYNNSDLTVLAFQLILDELRDIGIVIDGSSYLGDYYYMDKVYQFRKVFDPIALRIFISEHTELYDDLCSFLTTEDLDMSDVLSDVLNLFIIHDLNNVVVYKSLLSSARDNIVCNKTLFKYIAKIVDDVKYLVASKTFGDAESTVPYIKKIYNGRIYFRTAMEFLCKKYDLPMTPTLSRIIEDYDLDKIANRVIKMYAYLDNEKSISKFPESVHELYTEFIVRRHHNNSMHHYEYWQSRNIEVTDLGILAALVAHHYEPGKTIDNYMSDIKDIALITSDIHYKVAIDMAHSLCEIKG